MHRMVSITAILRQLSPQLTALQFFPQCFFGNRARIAPFQRFIWREGVLPTEECFGWLKTIALMRKVRHRGVCRVDWIFTMACAAYNLVRMRNLTAAVPAV
jgi:hypothetical protein